MVSGLYAEFLSFFCILDEYFIGEYTNVNQKKGPLCGICDEHFENFTYLCSHICSVHGQKADIKEETFETYEQFLNFKENLENCGNFSFFKRASRQNVEYFNCNRSGQYSAKDNSGNLFWLVINYLKILNI